MAYYTFPPPFYSSSTPPCYATSTTIPAPLPSHNFSHGFSPPSPSPYTPSASYSTIPPPSHNPYSYGYSSYYNHKQQPPLPYSQPQPPPYSPSPPYCHHPPYQPIDVIQRSFDEMLQISQRSVNEFTQICQKSKNDFRASHKSIKASLNSIRESFEALCKQEHFQEDEEDPQEPSEVLQEQLQEELVEEEPTELPTETETFTVEGTPPKTAVELTQQGIETTTSQERQRYNATVEDEKSVSHAPSLPLPKPPELAAIPQLTPPDVNLTPAPPPKPPDLGFQSLSTVCQVSCEPTRPPPPPQPPDKISAQPLAPPPPPKPPDPSFQSDDAAMPPPSRHQNRPLFPYAEYHDTPSQKNNLLEVFPAILHQSLDTRPKPLDMQRLTKAKSQPLDARRKRVPVVQDSIQQICPTDSLTDTHVRPIEGLKLLPFSKAPHQPFDPLPLPNFRSPPFIKSTIHVKHLQPTTTSHVPIHLLWNSTKMRLILSNPQDSGCKLGPTEENSKSYQLMTKLLSKKLMIHLELFFFHAPITASTFPTASSVQWVHSNNNLGRFSQVRFGLDSIILEP